MKQRKYDAEFKERLVKEAAALRFIAEFNEKARSLEKFLERNP